jgi:phage tail-like protein
MSSTPTPAPATATQQPLSCARFLVQFGTANATPVAEVTGIEVDVAAVETREGGDLTSPQKLPGQLSYANLVLQRPLTKDLTFWIWMQEVIAGSPSEKNMTVTLLDSQQNPAIVWAFKNAFPLRWTGPVLNALSNDFATETLEIAHSGFSMTTP